MMRQFPFARPVRSILLALGAVAALAPPALADSPATGTGLRAEYFNDAHLQHRVLERIDPRIDFDWGTDAPAPGVDGDTFSVRWTGTVVPRYSETYTFITKTDDGVRLWVDGQLIVDDWTQHSARENHGTIALQAGHRYDIKMEFYDGPVHAVAILRWRSDSQGREVVPTSQLLPAAPPAPGSGSAGPSTSHAAPAPGLWALQPEAPPTDTTATPPAADLELPPPATPEAGETFNALPLGGEVLVRLPGEDRAVPLHEGASLPVGTNLDTRAGFVRIHTAPARGVRRRQHATLTGATFTVAQPERGERIVTLDLTHGDFEACPAGSVGRAAPRRAATRRAGARSAASRRASRSRSVRSLWGSGKGRFRTAGRRAAANVRGTIWNVEDLCDATVTRVREGVVDVVEYRSGRTVTLREGDVHVTRG